MNLRVSGTIATTFTSTDGITGLQWIERLERKDIFLSSDAKFILNSALFIPTTGVKTKNAILKAGPQSIFEVIDLDASLKGSSEIRMEQACQIREALSDWDIQAMGLSSIITVHEPVNGERGKPNLLMSSVKQHPRMLETYPLSTSLLGNLTGIVALASQWQVVPVEK